LLIPDAWVIAKGSQERDVAIDMVRFATNPMIQAALAAAVPLGPVVPAAFDFIPGSLRPVLPTAPEHLDQLILVNTAWWARYRSEANEQFNCWLLGGPCLYPTPTTTGTMTP
jgi:putative spermidine/putrescine transport system substrate-binding protein